MPLSPLARPRNWEGNQGVEDSENHPKKDFKKIQNLDDVWVVRGSQGLDFPLIILLNVGVPIVKELLDGDLGASERALRDRAKFALADKLAELELSKRNDGLAGRGGGRGGGSRGRRLGNSGGNAGLGDGRLLLGHGIGLTKHLEE